MFDSHDFGAARAKGKEHGVTPVVAIMKELAGYLSENNLNKKVDGDKQYMVYYKNVDIGVAVDVGTGLRTVVVKDVANKTHEEIGQDIANIVEMGKAGNLPAEMLDLSTVCWSVTSIGKGAARFAVSVLPPGTAGILSIGRMAGDNGKSLFLGVSITNTKMSLKKHDLNTTPQVTTPCFPSVCAIRL